MLRALLLGSALSLPVSAAVGSFGRDQFAFNLHIELRNDTPLYSHVDPPPAVAWVKAHPDYASHGVLTN